LSKVAAKAPLDVRKAVLTIRDSARKMTDKSQKQVKNVLFEAGKTVAAGEDSADKAFEPKAVQALAKSNPRRVMQLMAEKAQGFIQNLMVRIKKHLAAARFEAKAMVQDAKEIVARAERDLRKLKSEAA